MPLYQYECEDCGNDCEVFSRMKDKKSWLKCSCGGRLEAILGNPLDKSGDHHAGFSSLSLAVHPSQIQEAIAKDEQLGVSTDGWTKCGKPIFNSRPKFKKYMKAHGFHENNSYY